MAISQVSNLPQQYKQDLQQDYARQLTGLTSVPLDTSRFAPSVAGPLCIPPSFYDFIFTEIFGCNTCGYVDVAGEDDQIQVK